MQSTIILVTVQGGYRFFEYRKLVHVVLGDLIKCSKVDTKPVLRLPIRGFLGIKIAGKFHGELQGSMTPFLSMVSTCASISSRSGNGTR
jgi:hypothetical protein